MPTVFLPFAQFIPDGGRLRNPGLLNAENVAPLDAQGFVPLTTLDRFAASSPTLPLITPAATPQASVGPYAIGGAAVFIPTDETWFRLYAATMSGIVGEEARVFLSQWDFAADGTVTAASVLLIPGVTTVQSEGWFFQVYGNSVVMVGGHDAVPQIDVDATEAVTGFQNLWSGSSPKSPSAKYVATIGLHLLLGNIKEAGTVYPNRVWWSATDDIRFYSDAIADPDKRTGFQDLNDEYGPVTGLVGGSDYAYVAKAGCWYRMDFGGPFDYQFKPFGIGMGASLPHSICKLGDAVYYWSRYGPAVIRPGLEPEPLGRGVFKRSLQDGSWVLEHGLGPVAGLPPHRMVAVVDEENELVCWAYSSQNALAEETEWIWLFDTMFVYNARHGRGSVVRNWFDTDKLHEEGNEKGLRQDAALLAAAARLDPEGDYPPDYRPAWPLFVPRQPELDGYTLWAPLLRVYWWLMTKGWENQPGGGANPWRNTVDWELAYSGATAAPVLRMRTGFLAPDEEGNDVIVKRIRPAFSVDVGGDQPEFEIGVSSLRKPYGQPSALISKKVPDERGWLTFPDCPAAPLHQIDLRIKDPKDVGEIEGVEVEYDYAGARR